MLTTILTWLRAYPALAYGVWLQVGLALLALAAMPFDKRKILGVNPWIKPLKFDLSTLIVFVTIAAILTGIEGHATARYWIAAAISVSLSSETGRQFTTWMLLGSIAWRWRTALPAAATTASPKKVFPYGRSQR